MNTEKQNEVSDEEKLDFMNLLIDDMEGIELEPTETLAVRHNDVLISVYNKYFSKGKAKPTVKPIKDDELIEKFKAIIIEDRTNHSSTLTIASKKCSELAQKYAQSQQGNSAGVWVKLKDRKPKDFGEYAAKHTNGHFGQLRLNSKGLFLDSLIVDERSEDYIYWLDESQQNNSDWKERAIHFEKEFDAANKEITFLKEKLNNSEEDMVSREEYEHAIDEVDQLQEQLKQAEEEIRDLNRQDFNDPQF